MFKNRRCPPGVFPALAFVADFPPVAPEFHRRTSHVRLRNLDTTDKKSSHKIKHRKIPGEHRRTLGGKIENESSYLSRRLRHQDQRRKPFKTKANDRDR